MVAAIIVIEYTRNFQNLYYLINAQTFVLVVLYFSKKDMFV